MFPGAAACVSWRDEDGHEEVVDVCAGTLTKGGARVQESSFYDLGALTQAFVATAALRLAARQALSLEATAESLVADTRGGVLGSTTLRQLFLHRGGLAAWGGLYLDVPHDLGSPAARRWIFCEAARRPAERPTGRLEVSDLGYIIAGEAMARAAGASLDEVLDREVFDPLGLVGQIVYPGALPSERRATLVREAAPTERCEWRGRLVQGEAQDENAAALGGVAGHAGLFGTALAVARFGRAVLDVCSKRSAYLPVAALESALGEPGDGAHVRFGWALKHGAAPACGRRMGARTFGQLGFPGTSLYCDPERDAAIVLLSNRVCPSRANEKIDGFRPAFHDGVMAALG